MTEKLYLWSNEAICLARVVATVEADVPIVRLDRTLFHPHCANQRADRGRIDNAHVLGVHSRGASVDHYVDTLEGISVGQVVTQQVDVGWRKLQSAYHTAGHLIAYAMMLVKPTSRVCHTQHWPDNPNIVISGLDRLTEADTEKLKTELGRLIGADQPVAVGIRDGSRIVTIGRLPPVKCDGTHLRSTGQIKRIEVTRCYPEDATAVISYVTYLKEIDGKDTNK